MGRWSRLVARRFVNWLTVPSGQRWLDVGCGTGALTNSILALASPDMVVGVDPSESYIAYARKHVQQSRAIFEVGDAMALAARSYTYDVTVSGLVLNFVPQSETAVAEMARVTRSGGIVATYVWDYSEGMELIRHFWDAAVALDRSAVELDEGRRFPLCRPEPLTCLFIDAALRDVQVRAIEIPTVFRNFDDYWLPFLGGQGPAPAYAKSLNPERRTLLRQRIHASLPFESDGSIHMIARAWATRGTR